MSTKFSNFVVIGIVTCFGVDSMKTNIRCGTITFDPSRTFYFTGWKFGHFRGHTIRLKIVNDVDQVGVRIHQLNQWLHYKDTLEVTNNITPKIERRYHNEDKKFVRFYLHHVSHILPVLVYCSPLQIECIHNNQEHEFRLYETLIDH